jgi:hypothetical protein
MVRAETTSCDDLPANHRSLLNKSLKTYQVFKPSYSANELIAGD